MKPNLVLPLAHSYNERGVVGDNKTESGIDQRKINCFYEYTQNAITGKTEVCLTKRPGISDLGNTYGLSSQTAYLIVWQPNTTNDLAWIIVKDGNNVKAASSATTTTILNSASYVPAYIDRTIISGTDYAVLQLRSSFTTAHKTYYSSAIATWTEITDADYTALVHRGKMEHMDGYAFQLASDRYIYNSDLNSLSSWQASNRIAKSITLDAPAGLARLRNQLIAFGDETCEMFENAGNAAGSPLARISGLHARYGLGSVSGNSGIVAGKTHYYTIIGETMFFVGRMAGSFVNMGLFAYNGNRFEKVSDNLIDKLFVENQIYSVNTVGFHGKTAVAIQLRSPADDTGQRWLMFFPEQKSWFEWTSDVFSPVNNGTYFIGQAKSGASTGHKIYYFNADDLWQDGTVGGTLVSYPYTTQFRLPVEDGQRHQMAMYGVVGDTTAATANLVVSKSDNDYSSFETLGTLDLSKQRKIGFRGGSFYNRAIQLSYTGTSEVRLRQFIGAVE